MGDSPVLITPLLAGVANLTLHIGQEENGQPLKRFLVISENMRLASPVWNAMLKPDGPFTENGAKEVRFPEDDPHAFEVILRILHHQPSSLPDKLGFPLLLDLSFLVDKYEIRHLVSPFLGNWVSELGALCEDESIRSEEILSAAWTFGALEAFKSALLDLVINVKINKQGEMIVNGKLMNRNYLPESTEGEGFGPTSRFPTSAL